MQLYSKYRLGDSYAKAISQSIKYAKPVVFHAAENRFSEKGINDIMNSLTSSIKDLDLSKNKIDKEGIHAIGKMFELKGVKYMHYQLGEA
jgi:hypothetical protein